MSRENGTNSTRRRQFTSEDKATILRRHLADKISVSDLCDEYHIQPTLFYLWQRQAFERLSEVLQDGRTVRGQTQAASADRARVTALEAKLAKKDAIIAEVSEEYLASKKSLGRAEAAMGAAGSSRRRGRLRANVQSAHRALDALGAYAARAQLEVSPTQFYRWTARYGRLNTHNGRIPRDHWLTTAERRAILRYHETHAPEGYRRMTFMMLDADVVAVSPATVTVLVRF